MEISREAIDSCVPLLLNNGVHKMDILKHIEIVNCDKKMIEKRLQRLLQHRDFIGRPKGHFFMIPAKKFEL